MLTKRDMLNMQSGGARGLELRTAALDHPLHLLLPGSSLSRRRMGDFVLALIIEGSTT